MARPDCLEWEKARTAAGYGVTTVAGATKYVHRLEVERKIGRPLLRDEVVLHSCDNPPCHNIAHLSVGTTADNVADSISKGRNARGFMLPHTRLSTADVSAIRWFRAAGVRTKDVARLFQVHQSHVSKIAGGSRRPVPEG